MGYDDVHGPLPRHWKVNSDPDPSLNLRRNDLLIFSVGANPDTIVKIRAKAAGAPRNTPDAWGKSCTSTSPQITGYTYAITGRLEGGNPLEFTIEFKPATTTEAAKLHGSINGTLHPISWTAEEGP